MMNRLSSLKDFFRRHLLRVGLLAVAIPLLVHLWLQYESLTNLQTMMPVWRKNYMRRYLSDTQSKVSAAYQEKVEKTLNVPSNAFLYTYPHRGTKEFSEKFDYEKVFDLEIVWNHFAQHPFRGARLLFVGIVAGPSEPTYADVRIFDPVSCTFHYWPSNPERMGYRTSRQERGAAHAASAMWTAFSMANSNPKSFSLTVDERDPNNRIIVKPIVDEGSRLVGVAGRVVNEKVFTEEFLAPAIAETLPSAFPDDYQDVVILMSDSTNK